MDTRDRHPRCQEEPRNVAVAEGPELRDEARAGVVHAVQHDTETNFDGLIAAHEMRVMAIRLSGFLYAAQEGNRHTEFERMRIRLGDLANISRALRGGAALTPKEQGNG